MIQNVIITGQFKFFCEICGKGYSRLSIHLKDIHNEEIELKKQTSRFFCPSQCDLAPFQTMTLLLAHCESVHDNSLGKHKQLSRNYTIKC